MLPDEDIDNFGNKGYFSIQDNFSLSILANGDRLEELIEKLEVPFEFFEVIKITKEPKDIPIYVNLYRKFPIDLNEGLIIVFNNKKIVYN